MEKEKLFVKYIGVKEIILMAAYSRITRRKKVKEPKYNGREVKLRKSLNNEKSRFFLNSKV